MLKSVRVPVRPCLSANSLPLSASETVTSPDPPYS
ncbi:hypothetical protein Laurelin_BL5004 [Xanthomonas phage Laurelin]|nr:hypothetical protein Laurelin_BL5004 [Xanthomonas phage Laurelin]